MSATLIRAFHLRRLLTSHLNRSASGGICRLFCSDNDGSGEKKGVEVPRPPPSREKNTQNKSAKSRSDSDVDLKLVEAASGVGKQFGETEGSGVFSDLIQQLRDQAKLSESQRDGQPPPESTPAGMFAGMRVGPNIRDSDRPGHQSRQPRRRPQGDDTEEGAATQRQDGSIQRHGVLEQMLTRGPPSQGQGQYLRRPKKRTSAPPGMMGDPVNLYEGEALNIFPKKRPEDSVSVTFAPTLFDRIEKEELMKKLRFPPENAFEEMAQWTREGKLWKFPIDNEQGMEAEKEVPFYEHVFLEHLLKEFPSRGPVRHFMELVVVGLSKNPYLTVEQKHEHVAWFKDYFDKKSHILEEYNRTAEEAKRKLAEETAST